MVNVLHSYPIPACFPIAAGLKVELCLKTRKKVVALCKAFFYRYEGTRFRIKGFSTYHAAHEVACVWMYLTAAKKKKPGTLRYIYRLYRGYHKSVRVVIKT